VRRLDAAFFLFPFPKEERKKAASSRRTPKEERKKAASSRRTPKNRDETISIFLPTNPSLGLSRLCLVPEVLRVNLFSRS